MPSVKSEFDIPSKEINNEAASKIDDELFQNAITPSLSRAASEDRLGDAIEHLRGSQGSSQEAQGNGNRAPENYQGQNKARAEKAALRDWAASNGLLIHSLPDRFDPSGPDNLGGGEHDVWFDAAANRWIKSTNRQGEIMGAHPVVTEDGDWRIDDASPLQYLQRIKNWNDLIGDDVRLHAVLDDGNSLKVITSQPNIKGDPVSENEIEKAMQASDFMKMGHDVYYRKRDNQAIFDLKPENAVKKEGFLLPFDGIPVHPDADMIDALKESRFNEVLAKSKSTDSLNYEDSGLSVKFMPREASGYQWVQPERAKYDDSMVKADIDKMNRSWSKEDGFYIKPGTDPQRRIAGFTEWLKSNPGTPIETPEVTIDKDGDVSFVNGRHRFSYFRDNGAKSIWVSVEKPDAARFKKLYGSRE
jgi:hypothetical protein